MRVLVISQVCAPEMGAAANRITPIVREMIRAGHEVHIATGMPNYPQGVVRPGYEGQRRMTECLDGAYVHRTAHFVAPRNASKRAQLRNYLSFVPAALRGGLEAPRPDVVFVTSPPIFPVVAGIALARLYRVPLVFDIRDLWPDEIVACGGAREGSAGVRIVRMLERWAYRAAGRVSCTTRPFAEAVMQRGVPAERIVMVPNGADLDLFRPEPRNPGLAEQLGVEGRFTVLYSGLLGIKHGLETVLDAAALLRPQSGVSFLFAGSGAREAALREYAREKGLTHARFLGEWPVHVLPRLLSVADVCVSSLLPESYLEKILSVKVFEYMACERPVIGAQSGETARVITESGAGLAVTPGRPDLLAAAISELQMDPRRRRAMGHAGRRYVEEHFSRTVSARRLIRAMEELVGEWGASRAAAKTRPLSVPQPHQPI